MSRGGQWAGFPGFILFILVVKYYVRRDIGRYLTLLPCHPCIVDSVDVVERCSGSPCHPTALQVSGQPQSPSAAPEANGIERGEGGGGMAESYIVTS